MKTAFAAGRAIQARHFMLRSNYLELHILQVGGNRMMRFSLPTDRRRLVRLLGAGVLVTGGACMPVLLAAGSAQAAACGSVVSTAFPSVACTITGALSMSAGDLSLTTPASLTWAAGLTGVDQNVVDTVAADQSYTVDDATGAAAGWNVTITATQFTVGGTGANAGAVLPDGTLTVPTFFTNGDASAVSVGDPTPWATVTPPTTACLTGSTCSVPTDTTAYPASIVTGAAVAPVEIYSTQTVATTGSPTFGTGAGSIVIGGSAAANPVAWWLNVPADAVPAAYDSTITMAVNSGP